MIYFIADTHFGHTNIIYSCNRPFSSAKEMDETIIKNWNSRVTNSDTVFILGDMFFRCETPEEILKQLKGKKRLIVGNHDNSWMTKFDYRKYFETIDNMLEISDGQRPITLCHYPMMSWNHIMRAYMIHGHIHNDTDMYFWSYIQGNDHILNAGVDINNFMPVTFDEMVTNNKNFKESNK